MKTKEDILNSIKQAAEEISLGRLQASSLSADARIIGDLALDSMDYATIMLLTEQKTAIKIREEGVDWAKIQTLDQLADLFVTNLSK